MGRIGQFTKHLAWCPNCKDTLRNGFGHNTPSADYTVFSNRHARKNGHTCTEPGVILNLYWQSARKASNTIWRFLNSGGFADGVFGGQQPHAWGQDHPVPDCDGVAINLGSRVAIVVDGPHIVRVGDSEVLIEAVSGRQKLRLITAVPFADDLGAVAGVDHNPDGLVRILEDGFAQDDVLEVDVVLGLIPDPDSS